MTTSLQNTPFVLTDEMKEEFDAVMLSTKTGKPLDPELCLRIRERSDRLAAENARIHGVQDIAVELIRSVRDEE